MKSGIYKISNIINEKIYIGSAVKFNERWNVHKYHLLKETHHNLALQNFVNKYGFDKLVFSIIETCEKGKLIEREQFYFDTIHPEFNVHIYAKSPKGLKRTPEQIARMISGRMAKSGYRKGFIVSKETRKKISDANRGKKRSEEQKKHQSKIMKGRKVSEETKLKISESNKGKVFSEETRKKLSLKAIGNTNGKNIDYKNPETRKKISEKLTGRKLSKEHCEKMSIQRKGKKLSESHRLNIIKSLYGNSRAKKK